MARKTKTIKLPKEVYIHTEASADGNNPSLYAHDATTTDPPDYQHGLTVGVYQLVKTMRAVSALEEITEEKQQRKRKPVEEDSAPAPERKKKRKKKKRGARSSRVS